MNSIHIFAFISDPPCLGEVYRNVSDFSDCLWKSLYIENPEVAEKTSIHEPIIGSDRRQGLMELNIKVFTSDPNFMVIVQRALQRLKLATGAKVNVQTILTEKTFTVQFN